MRFQPRLGCLLIRQLVFSGNLDRLLYNRCMEMSDVTVKNNSAFLESHISGAVELQSGFGREMRDADSSCEHVFRLEYVSYTPFDLLRKSCDIFLPIIFAF